MCISSLFKQPKIETPAMPTPPPAVTQAAPPPVPTSVESQSQASDMAQKRKKQLRSGLLSTIKAGGIFGSGSELGTSGGGKTTLG
jgi:hypothetical protein